MYLPMRIFRVRNYKMFFKMGVFRVMLWWCILSTVSAKSINNIQYDDNENIIPVDEVPFEIETDYETPHRCQDPETGTFFKLGAEWISPTKCHKITCEARYFPLVKKIECSEYFKTHNPKAVCDVNKMKKFPHCCQLCRGN